MIQELYFLVFYNIKSIVPARLWRVILSNIAELLQKLFVDCGSPTCVTSQKCDMSHLFPPMIPLLFILLNCN